MGHLPGHGWHVPPGYAPWPGTLSPLLPYPRPLPSILAHSVASGVSSSLNCMTCGIWWVSAATPMGGVWQPLCALQSHLPALLQLVRDTLVSSCVHAILAICGSCGTYGTGCHVSCLVGCTPPSPVTPFCLHWYHGHIPVCVPPVVARSCCVLTDVSCPTGSLPPWPCPQLPGSTGQL